MGSRFRLLTSTLRSLQYNTQFTSNIICWSICHSISIVNIVDAVGHLKLHLLFRPDAYSFIAANGRMTIVTICAFFIFPKKTTQI